MRLIQLPTDMSGLAVIRLLDWTPAAKLEPNQALLKELNRRRNRQSKISKERQQFITGMSVYRMTPEEKRLKLEYIQEWHHRIEENEL